ncbi:WhiB family transcriptional regulator [Streptomyces sp. NPDC101209]|uniref:WhiB family transcriptional regulator n=1 Tax=Streptomyces sp. NPDC101209 TaxID=3366129 RepID=UPI0037FA4F3E
MPKPHIEADPRIPFPQAETTLACRTNPGLFHYEGSTSPEDRARIERARTACRGCPIAEGCLKWALANPSLTRTGIWAATTTRQRTRLRRSLHLRLGSDWVGVVARADRARALRAQPRPPAASPAPQASPMWRRHDPYWQPLSPEQQRSNLALLDLAQRTTRSPRSTEHLAEAG